VKVTENLGMMKTLQTSSLISNYKNFDCSNCSDLKEGICFLTEYGEHLNNHHRKEENRIAFKKTGKLPLIFLEN